MTNLEGTWERRQESMNRGMSEGDENIEREEE